MGRKAKKKKLPLAAAAVMATLKVWQRLKRQKQRAQVLNIKCNQLKAATKAAVEQLNMDTTIDHITDFI